MFVLRTNYQHIAGQSFQSKITIYIYIAPKNMYELNIVICII